MAKIPEKRIAAGVRASLVKSVKNFLIAVDESMTIVWCGTSRLSEACARVEADYAIPKSNTEGFRDG